MMTLTATCAELGISQRELARQAEVSRGTLARILTGVWPRRDASAVRARIGNALRQAGASNEQLRALLPRNEDAGADSSSPASCPQAADFENSERDEDMLLQNTPVTPQALKHFGLPRSPFVDDIATRDDVFQSPSVRYVRAALLDAALHHGFVGVVGESGAGKTTLVEDLEQRIIDEGRDIEVIKPYVLGMEATDRKGHTLRAAHVAEAIVATLDPHATLKRSPQARFRQLHELLKNSRRAGRRHLLVIEEAHCLPLATLKHLKRFLELKDGLARVIGIALIAQPELRLLLHSNNPEVREVMQRIELVDLPPLDNELEAYLAHKFARFELRPDDVFEPDAFNALRARLVRVPRGARPGDAGSISVAYPLVLHNLVARAMNAAAAVGYPKVDAQVVEGC